MTTSVNYPSPVQVNGYSCKNCTDVDYAKKHIDPAHPKDGPFGVDAKDRPAKPGAAKPAQASGSTATPAVRLDGVFSGVSQAPGSTPAAQATGTRLDIAA